MNTIGIYMSYKFNLKFLDTPSFVEFQVDFTAKIILLCLEYFALFSGKNSIDISREY